MPVAFGEVFMGSLPTSDKVCSHKYTSGKDELTKYFSGHGIHGKNDN
jgi:hypothetical protein